MSKLAKDVKAGDVISWSWDSDTCTITSKMTVDKITSRIEKDTNQKYPDTKWFEFWAIADWHSSFCATENTEVTCE